MAASARIIRHVKGKLDAQNLYNKYKYMSIRKWVKFGRIGQMLTNQQLTFAKRNTMKVIIFGDSGNRV